MVVRQAVCLALVVCISIVHADVEDVVNLDPDGGDLEANVLDRSLPKKHDFWCTAGLTGRCTDQTTNQAWKNTCLNLASNKFAFPEEKEKRFGRGSCRARRNSLQETVTPFGVEGARWERPERCEGIDGCEAAIDGVTTTAAVLPSLPARIVLDLGRELLVSGIELWSPAPESANSTNSTTLVAAADEPQASHRLRQFIVETGDTAAGAWSEQQRFETSESPQANYYEAFELGAPKLTRFVALRVLAGWSKEEQVHISSIKFQLSENTDDFWCIDGAEGDCYDESSKHFWRNSCLSDPPNAALPASNASSVFGTGNCAAAGLSKQGLEIVASGTYQRMPGRSVPQQMLIDKRPVERLVNEPEETFHERCQQACDKLAAKEGSCGGFVEDKELMRAEPLCRMVYNETIDGSELKLSSVKLVGMPHHTLWIRHGPPNATAPARNFGWCAEQACGAMVATQLETGAAAVAGTVEWTAQQCSSAMRQRSIHCPGTQDATPGWCAAEWCGAQIAKHEVVPGVSWGGLVDPADQYLWTETYLCANRTKQQTLRCAESVIPTERSSLSYFRGAINGTLLPLSGRIEPMGGRVHEQVADAAACAALCINTGIASLSTGSTKLSPEIPPTEAPTAAPSESDSAALRLLGDPAPTAITSLVTGSTCESFDYSRSLEQCKLYSTSLLTGSTWGGPRGQWQHFEAQSSLRDSFRAPQLGVLAGSDHGKPFKQIGSPADCAVMCESEGAACRSFVYSGPARTCQLKFSTASSSGEAGEGLTQQDGSMYYERQGVKQLPFGWIKSRVQVGEPVWSGAAEEVLVGPVPDQLMDMQLLGPPRTSRKSHFLEFVNDGQLWLALDSRTTVKLTAEWRRTELKLHISAGAVFNIWTQKVAIDATVAVPYLAQTGEEWSGFLMVGPPSVEVSLLEPQRTVTTLESNQLMTSDREARFAPVPVEYSGLTQLLGPWYMKTAMSFFARTRSTVYVATPSGMPSGLRAKDGWHRDEGILEDASKTVRFQVDRKVFARGMVNIPMVAKRLLLRPESGRPTIVFVGSADRKGVLEDSLPRGYRVAELKTGARVVAWSGVRIAAEGLPLHLEGLLVLEGPTPVVKKPLTFVLDSESTVWVASRKGQPTKLSPDWTISAGVLIKMDDGTEYEIYRKQFGRGPATVPVEEPDDGSSPGRQGFVLVGDPTPLKCTLEGGGGNAGGGAQCAFPFSFNGNVYSDCVDGPPGAWCSTTAQYAGQWGRCGECESTFGGFRISTQHNQTSQLCIARHHSDVDKNKAVLPTFKPDSQLDQTQLGEPEDRAVQDTAPNWDHQGNSDAADQAKKRAAEAAASKLVFNPTDKVCDDANPASGKTESAAEIVSDADCARQCGLRLTPTACHAYSFSPAVPAEEKAALCWLYSKCELVAVPDGHPAAVTKLRTLQPKEPLEVPAVADGSLVAQPCDPQRAEQYWTLDDRGLLRPASQRHKHLFASVGAPDEKSMARSAGLGLTLRACEDGCRDEQSSQLELTEQGMLRSMFDREYVIVTAQAAVEHTRGNMSALEPEPPVMVQKCSSIGFAGPELCPWASEWKVEMPLSPAAMLAMRLKRLKESALQKVQLGIDLAKDALTESEEQGRAVELKANQMRLDLSRENSTMIADKDRLQLSTTAEQDQEQLLTKVEKLLQEAQAKAQLLPGIVDTALKESQDAITSQEQALESHSSFKAKSDQATMRLHEQKKQQKIAQQLEGRVELVIKSIDRLTQDSTTTQIRIQKDDPAKKAKDATEMASDATDGAKAVLAKAPAVMEKGANGPLQASKQEQRLELTAAAVASKATLNLASIAAAEKVLGDEKAVLTQMQEENTSKRTRELAEEKSKQHDVNGAQDTVRTAQAKLKEKAKVLDGDKQKLDALQTRTQQLNNQMIADKQHMLTSEEGHDSAKEGIVPTKNREANADTALAVAQKELDDANQRVTDAKLEYKKLDATESSKVKQAGAVLTHAKTARDAAQAKLTKAQRSVSQFAAAQGTAVQTKHRELTQLTDSKVAVEAANSRLSRSESQLSSASLHVQRAVQKQAEVQSWKSQLDTWVDQATQQFSSIDVQTSAAAVTEQKLAQGNAEQTVAKAGQAVKSAKRVLADAQTKAAKAVTMAAAAAESEAALKAKLAEDRLNVAKDDAGSGTALIDSLKKDIVASEAGQQGLKQQGQRAQRTADEAKAEADQLDTAADKASAGLEALDNKLLAATRASSTAETEYKAAVAAYKESQQGARGHKERALDANNAVSDTKKQMYAKCAASDVHAALARAPTAVSHSSLLATAANREVAAADKEKTVAEGLMMQAAGEASAAELSLADEADEVQKRQMQDQEQKQQLRKQQVAISASERTVKHAELEMQLESQTAKGLESNRKDAQAVADSLKHTADADSKEADAVAQEERSANEVAAAAASALARAQAKKAQLDARVDQHRRELLMRERSYQAAYLTAINDLETKSAHKMIRKMEKSGEASVTLAKQDAREEEEKHNADDVNKQSRNAAQLSKTLDYELGRVNRQTSELTKEQRSDSSTFASNYETTAETTADKLIKRQKTASSDRTTDSTKQAEKLTKGAKQAEEDMVHALEKIKPDKNMVHSLEHLEENHAAKADEAPATLKEANEQTNEATVRQQLIQGFGMPVGEAVAMLQEDAQADQPWHAADVYVVGNSDPNEVSLSRKAKATPKVHSASVAVEEAKKDLQKAIDQQGKAERIFAAVQRRAAEAESKYASAADTTNQDSMSKKLSSEQQQAVEDMDATVTREAAVRAGMQADRAAIRAAKQQQDTTESREKTAEEQAKEASDALHSSQNSVLSTQNKLNAAMEKEATAAAAAGLAEVQSDRATVQETEADAKANADEEKLRTFEELEHSTQDTEKDTKQDCEQAGSALNLARVKQQSAQKSLATSEASTAKAQQHQQELETKMLISQKKVAQLSQTKKQMAADESVARAAAISAEAKASGALLVSQDKAKLLTRAKQGTGALQQQLANATAASQERMAQNKLSADALKTEKQQLDRADSATKDSEARAAKAHLATGEAVSGLQNSIESDTEAAQQLVSQQERMKQVAATAADARDAQTIAQKKLSGLQAKQHAASLKLDAANAAAESARGQEATAKSSVQASREQIANAEKEVTKRTRGLAEATRDEHSAEQSRQAAEDSAARLQLKVAAVAEQVKAAREDVSNAELQREGLIAPLGQAVSNTQGEQNTEHEEASAAKSEKKAAAGAVEDALAQEVSAREAVQKAESEVLVTEQKQAEVAREVTETNAALMIQNASLASVRAEVQTEQNKERVAAEALNELRERNTAVHQSRVRDEQSEEARVAAADQKVNAELTIKQQVETAKRRITELQREASAVVKQTTASTEAMQSINADEIAAVEQTSSLDGSTVAEAPKVAEASDKAAQTDSTVQQQASDAQQVQIEAARDTADQAARVSELTEEEAKELAVTNEASQMVDQTATAKSTAATKVKKLETEQQGSAQAIFAKEETVTEVKQELQTKELQNVEANDAYTVSQLKVEDLTTRADVLNTQLKHIHAETEARKETLEKARANGERATKLIQTEFASKKTPLSLHSN